MHVRSASSRSLSRRYSDEAWKFNFVYFFVPLFSSNKTSWKMSFLKDDLLFNYGECSLSPWGGALMKMLKGIWKLLNTDNPILIQSINAPTSTQIRKAIDIESVNWNPSHVRVRIISVTLFGGTCNRLTIATWKVFTIIASVRLESCACCSQHNSRDVLLPRWTSIIITIVFICLRSSHPRCSHFPLIHISFTRQGRRIAWKIRSLCQSIFVFDRRMPGSDSLHFPVATANWFTKPKVNCIIQM